jgi:hypothetical protein
MCCPVLCRLNGSRYKIAEKEEVLQWLLEASRFQQQTKQDQVSVTYKTYKMPAQPKAGDPSAKKGLPGGYWQGYMIKVGSYPVVHSLARLTWGWFCQAPWLLSLLPQQCCKVMICCTLYGAHRQECLLPCISALCPAAFILLLLMPTFTGACGDDPP